MAEAPARTCSRLSSGSCWRTRRLSPPAVINAGSGQAASCARDLARCVICCVSVFCVVLTDSFGSYRQPPTNTCRAGSARDAHIWQRVLHLDHPLTAPVVAQCCWPIGAITTTLRSYNCGSSGTLHISPELHLYMLPQLLVSPSDEQKFNRCAMVTAGIDQGLRNVARDHRSPCDHVAAGHQRLV